MHYNMTQPTHSTHIDLELDSLLLLCSNIFELQQESEIEQPASKCPRQDSGSSSTALVPSTIIANPGKSALLPN